jgi:hypothetical protein
VVLEVLWLAEIHWQEISQTLEVHNGEWGNLQSRAWLLDRSHFGSALNASWLYLSLAAWVMACVMYDEENEVPRRTSKTSRHLKSPPSHDIPSQL